MSLYLSELLSSIHSFYDRQKLSAWSFVLGSLAVSADGVVDEKNGCPSQNQRAHQMLMIKLSMNLN